MAEQDNTRGVSAVEVVPPAVVGSPVDLPTAPADAASPADATLSGNVPWWRPGWVDVLRVLGWRWLIFAPALIVGLGIPAGWIAGSWWGRTFAMAGIKPLITAWAVVVSLLAWGRRNVVRARRDPFCIHCGYSLTGLPDSGRCPECGRLYTPALIAEYRKDPHFFMERHKAASQHPAAVPFAAGRGATPDDGTS